MPPAKLRSPGTLGRSLSQSKVLPNGAGQLFYAGIIPGRSPAGAVRRSQPDAEVLLSRRWWRAVEGFDRGEEAARSGRRRQAWSGTSFSMASCLLAWRPKASRTRATGSLAIALMRVGDQPEHPYRHEQRGRTDTGPVADVFRASPEARRHHAPHGWSCRSGRSRFSSRRVDDGVVDASPSGWAHQAEVFRGRDPDVRTGMSERLDGALPRACHTAP